MGENKKLDAGKGDKPRPVDKDKYDKRYQDIDWSAHRRKKESDVEDLERMKIAAEMSKL